MDYMGRYWELHFASNSDVLCVWSGRRPAVTQTCVVCHKLHPDTPPAASFLDFACIQLDKGQEAEVLRTTNKLIDVEQVFKNRFYYLWNLVKKLSSHIS